MTADEVIKAQDRHLKEMVAQGDTTHERALKEMKGRWKKPIKGMGWYRQAKRDFAASRGLRRHPEVSGRHKLQLLAKGRNS